MKQVTILQEQPEPLQQIYGKGSVALLGVFSLDYEEFIQAHIKKPNKKLSM